MKTKNVIVAGKTSQLCYESPRVTMLHVELEHSIAAASVQDVSNSSITESWGTETQQQEVEW